MQRVVDFEKNLYTCFGEEPDLIEVHIGSGLAPLLKVSDGEEDSPLGKEILKCRKMIDEDYGLLIPEIQIYENETLCPYEYAFTFRGSRIVKSNVKPGHQFCLDTGNVTSPLNIEGWEKTKDPAFDMDGFFIPDSEVKRYKKAGYACVSHEKGIRVHLYEFIRKYRTKLLDQCMVNNLVEKVRKINPDVVSEVFYMNGFSVSELKLILNLLLDEEVSIRDMNTILETIADYHKDALKGYELAEKIRQSLAVSFISKYVDEDKKLHLIRVSQSVSDFLVDHSYYPKSFVEIPYCAFNTTELRKYTKAVSNALLIAKEKNFYPVLICVSAARLLLAQSIHREMPSVRVISDLELYECKERYPIEIEGDLAFDEE